MKRPAAVFPMRYQRGLSLVEAAIAMVILGVAATLFWWVAGGMWARENLAKVQSELARAEAAVQAFAALRGRLPCPGAEANGLESCDGRVDGYFPYLTVGVPEAAPLRYGVDAVALAPGGRFQVMANDRPIDNTSSPRARAMALHPLWASSTYDGVLDLCATLSAITAGGDGVAYSLAPEAGHRLVSMAQAPLLHTRTVHAAQVSAYLGCGPLVAVSGRGQYHAHLSGAIMAKAIQDYRVQSELGYATTVMEAAEGAWSVSHSTLATLKTWAEAPTSLSKLKAEMPDGLNFGKASQDFVLQAASLPVGLLDFAARESNLWRFLNNLNNFYNRSRVLNYLVQQSLENYQVATRNAMVGSSSAYFLREQKEVPRLPALPGPASNYGPNAVAQQIANMAQDRARDLGHGDLVRDYVALPTDALPPDQLPDMLDPGRFHEGTVPALDDGAAPSGDSPVDVGSPIDTAREVENAQPLADALTTALGDLMGLPIDPNTLKADVTDEATFDFAGDSESILEKLDEMENLLPGDRP